MLARIVDLPYAEFVRGGAELAARRDMHGIYRVLLRLASPERVAARLPRILSQYFDFGRIEGSFAAPKTHEATASGLPRPLALWLTSVAHGFVPVVIEKAGGRDVAVRIKPFSNPTVEHGVTLVTASFEVSWT